MARDRSFDVAVVGGGPAGACVARLCAALGHRVVLLHAEAKRGPEVESLPPSALAVVESMELSEVVRTAAVGPMTGTVVRWSQDSARTTDFETPGLQVSRARLDPALRFAAVSAGAVLRETRVRSADVLTDPFDVDCRVVVDAAGRSGPLLGTLRQSVRGWRTLAIAGVYAGVRPGDEGHTWTESFDRGWVWSVPAGDAKRQVTIMIDPPKGRGLQERALARFFEAEVARAAWTSERLAGARLEAVRAVAVVPSIARAIAAGRGLRVGDAACAVDPLSSFGLKKAFESARVATAVVNTMLRRPECADDARRAYVAMVEAELAGSMAGAAAEVARASVRHDGPFWKRRVFRSPVLRVPASPAPRTAGRLRISDGARIETRAVQEGWVFERRPVVVSDRFPQGLRHLGGLVVPTLVEAVRAADRADDVAAGYARLAGGEAEPDRIQAAITTLLSWGVLEKGVT